MASSMAQDDVIKVVSFNLRRDFGPQRKNRWETRKELAAKLISESNAAIIGVQEFAEAAAGFQGPFGRVQHLRSGTTKGKKSQ